MKTKARVVKIRQEGLTAVYRIFATCQSCGEEFSESGNIFSAKYCPVCAERIKREKTRERVKRYRERKAKESTLQGE